MPRCWQIRDVYKRQQQAAAKEEIGKPFPFEDDLRVKSARLVELDTLLNIDGTVSYTHLDVYKRQLHGSPNS